MKSQGCHHTSSIRSRSNRGCPFHPKPLLRTTVLALISLLLLFGVLLPWSRVHLNISLFSTLDHDPDPALARWRHYTLTDALSFVSKNNTIIVCAVSLPYLPFLNNWLISIVRLGHHHKVLVITEDYTTLYKVNEMWPGHAVLIPPVLDALSAHKFGSEGFFNFTARRPQHLLNIVKLGYNVMYNDVDMVWLADPFPSMEGNHDIYFMDDVAAVKPTLESFS